jgi:4-aminobutyrate aminotransferase-like enzyme/Ser/Thr protein kinase RdoA (MazF antagonist)
MTQSDPSDEAAVLDTPAPSFSVDEARRIASQYFAIEADASPLESERDQNFHLEADAGQAYVLKIANPAEQPEVLAFQTAALRHVEKTAPGLPVPRVISGVDGDDLTWFDADDGRYLVRAVTYLPGTPFHAFEPTSVMRREVGALLARLDVALNDFLDPPPAQELLWDLSNAARLKPLLGHIADEGGRQLVSQVLDDSEGHVQPRRHSLRAQVIHNDFNRGNLLVADEGRHSVCGMIDFGDMVHAPLVNDLAIAVAYQLIQESDPLPAARDVVGAYQGVNPLVEEEVALLYDLIGTRMAQSLTIGAWRASRHPDNAAYILTDQAAFLEALAHWRALDRGVVTESLRAVCGMPGRHTIPANPETGDALARRRRRALGKALRLTYDEPLHIVRGEGVWLYDQQGRRFLDAYNNVACVGHGHPGVVAALTRQAKALNTNTRYLHEHIVEYAERLTATLPDPLSVCMFVCTGTEANDLAWQLARACTGADGAIVTDNAYHGNSTAVSQLSPEELLPGLEEDWVATVPAPDVYSGRFRPDEGEAGAVGERYAACLNGAIDTLRDRGHRPAAFIVDTVYTSDGIFTAPDGYLDSAWRRVRAAGGLCIADEVQAGFGRTGDFMWGFEQQGVVPDIVTLGKPIGNGHPLAAVVTTPQIAAQFAGRRYYFNTFGGNPVSCAVGLSVLEILQREELQENARVTGGYLQSRISEMAEKYPVIGDVRGPGLMVAVELVQDRATREPATDLCARVVNAMRESGVLIGRTGLHGQVLKIRPPLVFSRGNADLLVSRLDEVLAEGN